MKPAQCPKDTALKSVVVVEFHPTPKSEGGMPIPPEDKLGMPKSDYKDDLLVNGLITSGKMQF